MYHKMLATRDIFPQIGDVSKELEEPKKLITTVVEGSVLFEGGSDMSAANDDKRFRLATMLHLLCMEYLIHHEVCHILEGHFGYAEQFSKSQSYFENQPSIAGLNAFARQTLEWSADVFAFRRMKNNGRRRMKPLAELKEFDKKEYDKAVILNINEYYEYMAFSIYCFFKLCDIGNPELTDTESRTHPHPKVRATMMILELTTYIIFEENEPETMLKRLHNSVQAADKAFLRVTYRQPSPIYANDQNAKEYINSIWKNWDKVKSLIQPFAYHPEKMQKTSDGH
jgi:hypothetical protein